MAVKAQYPSNIIPDIRNSATPKFGIDNRELFSPNVYTSALVEDCKLSSLPGVSHVVQQQPLLQSVAPSIPDQPGTTVAFVHPSAADMSHQALRIRKRIRDPVDLLSGQRLPPSSLGDSHPNWTASPLVQQPSGLVSTGLRLAFDEEHASNSTTASRRAEMGSTALHTIFVDVSTHLRQQQVDFDQFLTTQGDKFRQGLEERRQRHSGALLAFIEDIVSKRLNGQEIEIEKVNRRNVELEDRVKHLSFEAYMWQNKAKINEAMVTALRSDLQQAVVQKREQSKEGHGYSDAEDAASANYDENTEAQAWVFGISRDLKKDLARACKICRTAEVCILLLPCRHLCLCKICEGSVERCPVCQCLKSASVEVYMS